MSYYPWWDPDFYRAVGQVASGVAKGVTGSSVAKAAMRGLANPVDTGYSGPLYSARMARQFVRSRGSRSRGYGTTKRRYGTRFSKRPKAVFRRKVYRRRRSAFRRRPSIRRKVYKVQRTLGATVGHHTHKTRAATERSCAVKSCAYSDNGSVNLSLINTAIANLRIYDSATAALKTVDWGTGTYQRDIMIDNIYSKIEVRNNYHVPCQVRVYYCATKHDAASGPSTSYSNGLADQTTGPSTSTDPLVYPTEVDQFNRDWKVLKTKSAVLQAGQMLTCVHSTGSFTFSPAAADVDTSEYQKRYKGFSFLLRIEGMLGHDTGNVAEYATLEAGVDVLATKVVKITYDAGTALDDISTSDSTSGTFTTAGVTGNKPIADNARYLASD